MSALIQPVRGMNDILPEDAPLWERLESAAAALFRAYGYRQIRIPVLERTELFRRSIGELTDIVEKEMYTFTDRNGDSLTLRPEATAGVVRAALSNGLLHNQQHKVWCAGPMFRREKPQQGRYRQFHQLNVEALGYEDPEVDAELIVMSAKLWKELDIEDVSLELNSLGTPESRAGYKRALVEYFSAYRGDLDEDSVRRLERNPMRILDSKNPDMQALIAGAPVLGDHLDPESAAHFERVQMLLDDVGIEFSLNSRLVRGLDYYTRTVFEWLTDRLGAQSAVCSGGRYDGLVRQLGGRGAPAIGWALGIERVVELMRAEGWDGSGDVPDVYVVGVGDEARRMCFGAAERLRAEIGGIRLSMGSASGGFKAQMRRADKSGASFALIAGDEEIEAGVFGLKALRDDSPQRTLALDDVVAALSKALSKGD